MATTQSGFVKFAAGAATVVKALSASVVNNLVAALGATRFDAPVTDLAFAGFAKNGCVRLALVGTTVKAISLSNLTTTADSYDGDTAFASFLRLILVNDGAAAVAISPSGSNGASLGLTALTVPAGGTHVLNFPIAVTVDGTHFSIDVTPTSGGSFVLVVGGA